MVTVGDEIVDTTRALTAGLVHDSVSVMLTASGDQAGTTAAWRASRRDTATLARTIEDQLCAPTSSLWSVNDGEIEPGDGLVAGIGIEGGRLRDLVLPAGARTCNWARTVGEDQIPVVTVGRTPLSAFVGFGDLPSADHCRPRWSRVTVSPSCSRRSHGCACQQE